MQIILQSGKFNSNDTEACLISAFSSTTEDAKTKKKTAKLSISHWPKEYTEGLHKIKSAGHFHGNLGETFSFTLENGTTVLAYGLGEKSKLTFEKLRREMGKLFPAVSKKFQNLTIWLLHCVQQQMAFVLRMLLHLCLFCQKVLQGAYTKVIRFQ